jgi:hypothetical protein
MIFIYLYIIIYIVTYYIYCCFKSLEIWIIWIQHMKQLSSITSIGFIILRNQLYLPLKGAA